ncbi:tRNA-specific adenosine deaminase [Candidatus Fokinia solitaria]|uniref:tRNA-specific adenosine deaminase n=1 Tax=Candidatus Fokinia solitaria TaxID=1802984 RepID=A0A2U8BST6_9RICK|nr:nucleoside deaminase [Candidatus Fokinia solitaria]AWD33426.1 tRNA-specific adenosine deaminase [Candidatus Fokinia solitaria]
MSDYSAKDRFYMQIALDIAQKGADVKEVPVGAVIVNIKNDTIVAATHNLTIQKCNRNAHAEMIAISKASDSINMGFLDHHAIYVTLEPCAMCAKALSLSRVRSIYYAADDAKGGAIKNGVRIFDDASTNHKPLIYSGLFAEESSILLKNFFNTLRKK